MKTFLLAALAVLTTSAAAMDLKGLAPGTSYRDARSLHQSLDCEPTEERCKYIVNAARGGSLDTFAGQPADYWVLDTIDGKVATVSVLLASAFYPAVVAAMKEKYGAGRPSSAQVQTLGGAVLPSLSVSWTKGDETITVSQHTSDLASMKVVLTSRPMQALRAKREKADSKSAKKDL